MRVATRHYDIVSLDEIENRISSRLVDRKISVLFNVWRRISAAIDLPETHIPPAAQRTEKDLAAVQNFVFGLNNQQSALFISFYKCFLLRTIHPPSAVSSMVSTLR